MRTATDRVRGSAARLAWWNRGVSFLFVILLIAVVTAIGLASVGRLGELPDPQPDATPTPALAGDDPSGISFDIVARGYRMSEVDATVAALRQQVADLERGLVESGGEAGEPR